MQQSSRKKLHSLTPDTEAPSGSSIPAAHPTSQQASTSGSPITAAAREPAQHSGSAQDPRAIPLQSGPLGTYYQYHASYAASGKGISSGEKQALAAGVFVIASLAAALGIGWWITPPSPPSLADIEARRAQQQPVLMATEEEGMAEDEALAPDTPGYSTITRFQQGLKEIREASRLAAEQSAAEAEQPRSLSQPKQAASDGKSPAPPESATQGTENDAQRTREEELRRLKAQAYSETRKDRLGSAKPAKPAPKAEKSSRSASRDRAAKASKVDLSEAVAKCENEVGLFYRERCKWRLCNGRWGKNGCPSYQRDARAGFRIG